MGGVGIQQRPFLTGSLLDDVRAIGNGLDGIAMERSAQISHCLMLRNGRVGLVFLDGSATENLIIGNGSAGMLYFGTPSGTPPGSGLFSGNVSLSNQGAGFSLIHPTVVVENVAAGNTGVGIHGSGGAARNVAAGNGIAQIFGALSTGPNACNGAAC